VWLNKDYLQRESVWLVTFKKVVPSKHVNRDEVLDQLISSGLIDGVRQQVDDQQTMQLISTRKLKPWAMSYKVRAERRLE